MLLLSQAFISLLLNFSILLCFFQLFKGITYILVLGVYLDGVAAGCITGFPQGHHMHALGLTEADGSNANIVAVHINLHILRCVNVHLVIILSGVVACAVTGRNRCVRTGLFVLIAVRAFQFNLNAGGSFRHL